jgi:uncharacterized membrane protein YkoI
MSSRTRRGIAAAAVVAVLGGGGAAIAIATGGDDDDDATEKPITGGALQKAKAAALDHTGGGSVSGTEVGDEESYYEVEVTRDDGSQVDVQLDRDFGVVGAEDDDDSKEDEGEDE